MLNQKQLDNLQAHLLEMATKVHTMYPGEMAAAIQKIHGLTTPIGIDPFIDDKSFHSLDDESDDRETAGDFELMCLESIWIG